MHRPTTTSTRICGQCSMHRSHRRRQDNVMFMRMQLALYFHHLDICQTSDVYTVPHQRNHQCSPAPSENCGPASSL